MKPNICFFCLKTFPKSGSCPNSKFWSLAKSYLGVKTDDGEKSKEESFCGDCERLVRDVCGLYSELTAVQLRLSYKLGEMGELLHHSKTTVSDKLGQLLIRRLAEQMNFDTTLQLDQLRDLLMTNCQLKRKQSMPDVRAERMRMSTGLSLSLASSHPSRQSEFQVEYIMVEREEESTPAPHQDHDDYDNDLPSPNPPSPQPGRSDIATPGGLPKDIQRAIDLLPTKNNQGRDLKPKKKYMKLPDVEPLPKRRKTVLNKSYAEVDEHKDLTPAPSSYVRKTKKKPDEDEYVPPEGKEPPQYSKKGRRIRAPGKDKQEVKAQKITFFQCQLIRIEEAGESTFKCSKCDAVVQNRWDLLRAHVVKEHTDRIVCSQCGMKFGRLCNLRSHMATHTRAGQPVPKLPCGVCGRPCSAKSLQDHMWTHYSEEDKAAALARGEKLPFRKNKKFQCHQCEKSFYSMGTMEAHIKEVHEGIAAPQKRKSICTVCGAEVYNLAFHMKQMHGSYEDRKFVCVTCDKKFSYQYALRSHQFHKHGVEKPFMCSECGKGFKCKNSLKQHHTNIHVNAKEYQCEYCPMKFTQKKVWYERHLAKQHGVGAQQRVEVVEDQEQDVKLGEVQLQAVNLCQQNFGGGVVPLPTSNLNLFY